jgi:hypothetical protein
LGAAALGSVLRERGPRAAGQGRSPRASGRGAGACSGLQGIMGMRALGRLRRGMRAAGVRGGRDAACSGSSALFGYWRWGGSVALMGRAHGEWNGCLLVRALFWLGSLAPVAHSIGV